MARIVIAQPTRSSRWSIALHEGVTRIGTAMDQDLRIEDPSVAKAHCELVVAQGRVFVRDLGSGLDTLNDGSRVVGTTRVRDGQVLRVGKVDMRIESEFSDLEPLTSIGALRGPDRQNEERSPSAPPRRPVGNPNPSANKPQRGTQDPETVEGAAIEHELGRLRRLCTTLILLLAAVALVAISLVAYHRMGTR